MFFRLVNYEIESYTDTSSRPFFISYEKKRIIIFDKLKIKSDSIVFKIKEIKSYAINKDSTLLFIIIGSKKKFYGDVLKIFSIKNCKIIQLKDYLYQGQNPWKVRIGDLNNDGIIEIIVGVWKKVYTENKYRKRLHIYSWEEDNLKPIWLSSRLSASLIDFEVYVRNENNKDEIISLELQRNGQKRISSYIMGNFGLRFNKILVRNLNILNLNNYIYKMENIR